MLKIQDAVILAIAMLVAGSPLERRLAPIVIPDVEVETTAIIENHYIVELKPSTNAGEHQSSFLNSFIESHQDVKLEHVYEMDWFQGYSMEIGSEESLTDLRLNEAIESIEPDRSCHIAGRQDGAIWNLARISQRELPLQNFYEYEDKAGEGVDAYVMDTGIFTTHSEFEGRAEFGASFTGGNDPDPHGHGTHVAGTIASRRFGVAKKARVIAVQVLDNTGFGTWSRILAGLQWSVNQIRQRGRPGVINMSISGGKSDAVNKAVNGAIKNGFHVVVAAGNNGVDACNESPASALYVITVGSTDSADRMSDFSNFGRCVDIMAPGEAILSTYTRNNFAAAYMSGTSMACPHVAGVKALWLARRNDPPAVLDAILRESATKNTIDLSKNTVNYFLYNAPVNNLTAEDGTETRDGDDDGEELPPEIPDTPLTSLFQRVFEHVSTQIGEIQA